MLVEFVPPLGRLESLEVLVIYKWLSVKKVGVEFLGIDGTIETKTSSSPLILFPSLKRLEFEYMPMWEEWEGMTGWSEEEDSQKTITIMPCLSSLRIIDCHVLKTLPNFLRNTPLKELIIEVGVIFNFLAPVAQGCRKGRGEWPKISHIPNIKVGKEFVQKDGVYQIDDDEMPSVASTSSSGNVYLYYSFIITNFLLFFMFVFSLGNSMSIYSNTKQTFEFGLKKTHMWWG